MNVRRGTRSNLSPNELPRQKKNLHLLKRQLISERFVTQKETTSKEATITRIEVPGQHRIPWHHSDSHISKYSNFAPHLSHYKLLKYFVKGPYLLHSMKNKDNKQQNVLQKWRTESTRNTNTCQREYEMGYPLQDQGKGLKTMREGRLRRQTRPLPTQSHFGPVCQSLISQL